MVDRYKLFKSFLSLLENMGKVTDADMNGYCGCILFSAVIDGAPIDVELHIVEPKDEKDA